jgi:cell division protein FtsQ
VWSNARLLNTVALLIALMVCAASLYTLGHWLTHRPLFTLRVVRVDAELGGLRHVDAAALRVVALPSIKGNFFSVNLESVRQAFEAVAWVRHARVRREWPNRLVVKLEEHEVLGIWNDDRLLNTFGEVFSANLAEAEAEGSLPLFYGPEGSENEVRQRYADLVTWFAPAGLRPIELALSARYAWTLHLGNGTPAGLTVELGREADATTLYERVARLLAAYPEIKARWPKVSFLDMRYPNGFALRAEGAQGAAPAGSVQQGVQQGEAPAAPAPAPAAPLANPRRAAQRGARDGRDGRASRGSASNRPVHEGHAA